MTIELTTLAAVLGVGIPILIAAVTAAITYGRVSQRVTHVEAGLERVRDDISELRSEMRSEIRDMRSEIRDLRVELERTNRLLIGLANHQHDNDGRIMFTIPQTQP